MVTDIDLEIKPLELNIRNLIKRFNLLMTDGDVESNIILALEEAYSDGFEDGVNEAQKDKKP